MPAESLEIERLNKCEQWLNNKRFDPFNNKLITLKTSNLLRLMCLDDPPVIPGFTRIQDPFGNEAYLPSTDALPHRPGFTPRITPTGEWYYEPLKDVIKLRPPDNAQLQLEEKLLNDIKNELAEEEKNCSCSVKDKRGLDFNLNAPVKRLDLSDYKTKQLKGGKHIAFRDTVNVKEITDYEKSKQGFKGIAKFTGYPSTRTALSDGEEEMAANPVRRMRALKRTQTQTKHEDVSDDYEKKPRHSDPFEDFRMKGTELRNRINTGKYIVSDLKELSIPNNGCCIDKLVRFPAIGELSVIAEGGFGMVYHTTIKGTPVILKQTFADRRELSDFKTLRQLPSEYVYSEYVSNFLKTGQSHNFLYFYGVYTCDPCIIQFEHGLTNTTNFCFMGFIEAANSTIKNLLLHEEDEEIMMSLLYQGLLALHYIHSVYMLFHNDIKYNNFLIKKTIPGGLFNYVIDGKNYYVKNMGYVLILSDFGISYSMSPKYATSGYRGKRYARYNGNTDTWEPFKTKYMPVTVFFNQKLKDVRVSQDLLWDTGYFTKNIFFEGVNSKPSIPIDLNDYNKFPPFEFYEDIQDLLYTFLGFDDSFAHVFKMSRGWNHMRDLLRNKLKLQGYLDYFTFKSKNTSKYIFALKMLDEYYVTPEKDAIVNTFFLNKNV